MYKIILSTKATRHTKLLKKSLLEQKARELLDIIKYNPYQPSPPYEKLIGDYDGAYSRRINRQHRLIYTVDEKNKEIHVLSMWTHYE